MVVLVVALLMCVQLAHIRLVRCERVGRTVSVVLIVALLVLRKVLVALKRRC